MRKLFCLTLACLSLGTAIFAQAKPARPAPTVKVATVNGKALTVGGLRELLRNAPQNALQGLRENPKEMLTNYTLTRQLSDEARASGLDKKFPYQQRLDWDSLTILWNAQVQAMLDAIEVPETEIRETYNKNIANYRFMQVSTIRILWDKHGGPEKAKAVAEDVVRQARAGVSFVTLGQKYSSEPDLAVPNPNNTITPAFDLPEAAKTRLFSTLPGQVTDPIQMVDSYVIFRVESLKATQLADVRADIKGDLQEQRSHAQLDKIKDAIQVKVLMPQFFDAYAPNPAPGAPKTELIDPTGIVAEVNGRAVSAKEMSENLLGMSPTARQQATKDNAAFLVQYEMLKAVSAEARKAGLDKKPPASDLIAWQSDSVLFQGQIDEKTKSIASTLQEQEDYYKANQSQYRVAETQMIYLGFSVAPPPGSSQRNETQTLQRAVEAKRKFNTGTPITELVAQYSDDPESKARNGQQGLRYADPNLPAAIRDAVFAAKEKQMVGPVRLPNGFYLFHVLENKIVPFEEVRNDIYNLLADGKFKLWFDEVRGKIAVTIDDEAALKAELAYH
jgi:parvulin-like peptidyl-prolyl isomerase